jgi:transketolase C-terminal domain/subunit
MTAPIITIVEAKNEYIMGGLGQCIAEMVAAAMFNKQEGAELPVIYGVVTTGNIWKFLSLENNTVHVDFNEYHISQIEKIVSILISMIES